MTLAELDVGEASGRERGSELRSVEPLVSVEVEAMERPVLLFQVDHAEMTALLQHLGEP